MTCRPSLTDDPGERPSRNIYWASHAPWFAEPGSLPFIEGAFGISEECIEFLSLKAHNRQRVICNLAGGIESNRPLRRVQGTI